MTVIQFPGAAEVPTLALSSPEAEQAVLGAMLLSPAAAQDVQLDPADYAEPVHGRIHAAIKATVAAGRRADPLTLKAAFDADPSLSEVGGGAYLARLAGSAVSISGATEYAKIVAEFATRRRARAALLDAAEALAAPSAGQTAAEILAHAEAVVYDLAERGDTGRGPVSMAAAARRVLDQAERAYKTGRVSGVRTGISDVDDQLGAMRPGHMIVLAGRPGMGKTAFAVRIALNVAGRQVDGRPARVYMPSLEMPADDIAARQMAGAAGVSTQEVYDGRMTREQWEAACAMERDPAARHVIIDDRASLSIAQIRAKAQRLKARGGLDLVVVDYLQLVKATGYHRGNRVGEVTEISQGLKAMAKDLACPVLALSQLNRGVESREDKRPTLADLRDSGSIEQDADSVVFLYREEYYLARERPDGDDPGKLAEWTSRHNASRGVLEVIVAKARFGRTGSVRIHCDLARMAFSNISERG